MAFDKKIIIIVCSLFVIIGAIVYFGLQDEQISQQNDDPNAIVYYYGDGCPHCKVVNDFLEANPQVSEKVSFTKKEVWKNRANAKEMERRAKVCDIKPDGMGVPFLYGGNGKCYVGEVEVIDFFKEKSGIEVSLPIETKK